EVGAMNTGKGTITVAGLADLHVAETQERPYRALFAEISERADVLALCGDLTNLGTPREAEILAEDMESCTIPVVGVFGNHDCESGQTWGITEILRDAGLCLLETHVHQIGGIGFAGVKGFAAGFGRHMLGAFGEDAIKHFVAEAVNEANRIE